VREALLAHGIEAVDADSVTGLRERLNDVYLDEIRKLKARQRAGEIPLEDYSHRVEALKKGFPLLGLPLEMWSE
jgi:hypothetical protein